MLPVEIQSGRILRFSVDHAVDLSATFYYHEGRYESAADHQPDYLRLSQAERELAAKKGQEKA